MRLRAGHLHAPRGRPGNQCAAGADQITLAIGVHELSIPGTGEDAAAPGDLDVTGDLTIAGANAYLSVIDANAIDRVIDHAPRARPTR